MSDCGCDTPNEHIIDIHYGDPIVVHRCDACDDKLSAEIEWENEQFKEDDIVCPWCGSHFSEYEEMTDVVDNPYEAFEDTVTCPDCGNAFELAIEIEVSYTTRKPSEQFTQEEYEKWKTENE